MQILSDAGWVDRDGDGVRERGGQQLRFTLSVTDQAQAQAVFLQDQFRRIGARVDINTYGAGSGFRSRLRDTGDFDAAIVRYNYVEQFDTFPITGFRNDRLSALRDSVWFTIDHQEVDRYLREFWPLFGAELPVTFLHPRVDFRVARRWVRGLENDDKLFPAVERLWIEPVR